MSTALTKYNSLLNRIKEALDALNNSDMKFCRIFNQELNNEYNEFCRVHGQIAYKYWYDNHYDHKKIIENTNKLNNQQ